MDNLQDLKIDMRAYSYVKRYAIGTTIEALVELVTNAYDAYDFEGIDTVQQNRRIEIEINETPHWLKCRDHGSGLRADDLEKCFLQVGKYTSKITNRGFFSRGAKDVSALGNVTFESIKDGYYSSCIITYDSKGGILCRDEPVTEELRNTLKLDGNGTVVTVDFNPAHKYVLFDKLKLEIQQHYALRELLMQTTSRVSLSGEGKSHIIGYVPPKGKKILQMSYTVPNYPEAIVNFTLNLTDTDIQNPIKNAWGLNNGIMIKHGSACHWISFINQSVENDPCWRYLYGSIDCPYIATMMYDFDTNGPSQKNPSPVIDPSRKSGPNMGHPFIQWMLSITHYKLEIVLDNLRDRYDFNELFLDDVTIMDDINLLANELLELSFIQRKAKELEPYRRSIEDAKENFITEMEESDELDDTQRTKTLALEIKLVDNDKHFTKRSRHYVTSSRLMVEINLQNEIVKRYVDKDSVGKYNFNSRSGKIILSEILIDTFTAIKLDQMLSFDEFESFNSLQRAIDNIKLDIETKVYAITNKVTV